MKFRKRLLLLVAVVAVIAISFLCGNTFSKYITQVTGTGHAEVAKWFFKVNEKEDNIETIELGKTQIGNTNSKIAPGSYGQFDIVIDGTEAEVGIEYEVLFQNETNKPTNLKFRYQNKEFSSLKELESELGGFISKEDTQKKKTITIEWLWPYETGNTEEEIAAYDAIDTREGRRANTYQFDLLVTGVQVMPN